MQSEKPADIRDGRQVVRDAKWVTAQVILFALVANRYIVSGMTAGAVKG